MTTACRFSGMCSECLDTAIWANSASVGQLPSSRCAGAPRHCPRTNGGQWLDLHDPRAPPVQPMGGQAYFGRTVTIT